MSLTQLETNPQVIADLEKWARDTSDSARREYRQQLVAAVRDGGTIQNDGPLNAADQVAVLELIAKTGFFALTNCLDADVYGDPDVIEFGAAHLDRGGAMRFLIEEDLTWERLTGHPFVREMRQVCPTNFSVMLAASHREDYPQNFCVTDATAFRGEGDRNECKAEANFKPSEQGRMLLSAHQVMWAGARGVTGSMAVPLKISLGKSPIDDGGWVITSSDVPDLSVPISRDDTEMGDVTSAASYLISLKSGQGVRYIVKDGQTLIRD